MSRASEVIQSPGAAMQALRKAVAQDIRVAVPCKVLSYDPSTQTVSAQPLVHEKQAGQDTLLPVLNDVPVYFPGGANLAITHNVAVGDECLVIFADTSIDGWFASGSEQPGVTPRRHSLSDGFALVGYRSRPKATLIQDNYPFAVRMFTSEGWENVLYVEQYGMFHCKGSRIDGVVVAENYVSKYGYEFQNSSGTNVGGVFQDMWNNNNQVYIDEYTSAGKRECYLLPTPTATETTFYDILTTKNVVSVAQGGTGANTADGACENLGAVKKSGDTMSGSLGAPKVTLIAPNVDFTSAPSSTTHDDVIFVTDKDGDSAGILRLGQSTTNGEEFQFGARRPIGSDTIFNTLQFNISSTGSRTVDVSDPSAWRTGLGLGSMATADTGDYVAKNGDTMTGTLLAPTMKVYDASYPMFVLQSSASDTSALGAVYENIANRQLVLRQRSTQGYIEDYYLPVNSATSANESYPIITSKELIPWKTTTSWSTAIANAKMDIKVEFNYKPSTLMYCFVIDIPLISIESSYKFFFYSFYEGSTNTNYFAQIYARTASCDYIGLYVNGTAVQSNAYSYRFLYR